MISLIHLKLPKHRNKQEHLATRLTVVSHSLIGHQGYTTIAKQHKLTLTKSYKQLQDHVM